MSTKHRIFITTSIKNEEHTKLISEIELEQRLIWINKNTNGNNNLKHRFHTGLIKIDSRIDLQMTSQYIIELFGFTSASGVCQDLLSSCRKGIKAGFQPSLINNGTGGTYILYTEFGENQAIFKPKDEELKAPNNPKGFVGRLGTQSNQRGIRSGELYIREVAAFLLDKVEFHSVPKTTICEIHSSESLEWFHYQDTEIQKRSKVGSLQEFINSDSNVSKINPRQFNKREVHKLGILDIRILNCDRNEDNVLIKEDEITNSWNLVPIDHGLSIPEKIEISWCDWIWLNWPQSKESFDSFTREFIQEIDVDSDCAMLKRELNIDNKALENIRISCMLLKLGTFKGLSLFDIANIILRHTIEKHSDLEAICAKAEKIALNKLFVMFSHSFRFFNPLFLKEYFDFKKITLNGMLKKRIPGSLITSNYLLI